MKTFVLSSILALIPFLSLNAQAQVMEEYPQPAMVFQGDECFVVLVTDAGGFLLVGDQLHAVAANTKDPALPGKFTCKGYHSEPLEFPIVQKIPCFIPGTPFGDLYTEDAQTVYTPSGQWTAQCRFKKPSDEE